MAGTSQEVCDVKHTLSGKGLNCILHVVCNRFVQCVFIAQYIFTRRELEEKRNDKSRRYPSEPCLSNNATRSAPIYFLNSIQRVWRSRCQYKQVSNLFFISLFFISANIITLACLVQCAMDILRLKVQSFQTSGNAHEEAEQKNCQT